MRPAHIVPTGVERTFRDDEIIVSKTDRQGRLTYVNELFASVSAYSEAELIGKPHNIIRHPQMPRAVFALLWERLEAGREIFAYVVNLAGDGAHYWVLGHFTPTFDAGDQIVGFHSTRRTASRRAVAAATAVYDEILRAERAAAGTKAAVAAGRARLDEILAEAGLSYDEWVWGLEGDQNGEYAA
ncbi:PAS domain-containing protein [Nocardioides sp.]|jgi:PAS domain S-box-containing protein|uniref:PAS domain-containing protein n=1 Tax=Nocardioides sp. TaxID=35761 RepID=UPI002BABDA38|nr:PAS domain-containing protein [Nocardioides sp.]HVX55279.1 PAS domain-containing protein [Nocardioides sp.]